MGELYWHANFNSVRHCIEFGESGKQIYTTTIRELKEALIDSKETSIHCINGSFLNGSPFNDDTKVDTFSLFGLPYGKKVYSKQKIEELLNLDFSNKEILENYGVYEINILYHYGFTRYIYSEDKMYWSKKILK